MKKTTFILLVFSALLFTACKKMPELKVYEINLNNENVAYSQTSAEIKVDYEYPTHLQYVNVTMSRSNYFDYSFVARAEVTDSVIIANFVDLQTDKNYYYKFEYSNGVNVATSDVHSFYLDAAQVTLPTVYTMEVYEVIGNTAIGGGEIVDDGGYMVTARGVCWSTQRNPTIFDNYTTDGMGTGGYSSTMTNLEPNSIYYVRAYAINEKGTSYGTEFSFETYEGGGQIWENGVLPGWFSINQNQKVQFSQGNLQYQASTNTWRFAENQWEFVGEENEFISQDYSGWIDLFGWGTSGWNSGNTYYHPWDSNGSQESIYYYGPLGEYNLTGNYANADWGIYNAISNGGNTPNSWRTLAYSEWKYMLDTRTTSSGIRFVKGMIGDINGLIMLPDDWDSNIYTLREANNYQAPYESNVIDDYEWIRLEEYGAVFIPAAGSRGNTTLYDINSDGDYWLSTAFYDYDAYFLQFTNSGGGFAGTWRNGGFSVRLVRK